jgi:hypothetical protein
LEKAKKTYADATEKAKNTLVDGFATAIKTATGSGNLDVVKALQAEKEAFEGSGKLPGSPRMKTAATSYLLSMKQATTALDKAYEQAVKDLTKAGKLTEAETLQAELKEFRNKITGNLRPADVTTKEDLQRYLAGTVWEWDGALVLRPEGYVEQKEWAKNGIVLRWEALDRRTAIMILEKGRDDNKTCVMTFSEDLTEFRGYGFKGERLPASKRKQ